MGRIDLVEPWAIRNARKLVRESMQAHGEEVIALQMYHAVRDPNAARCQCFDDVYKDGGDANCPDCYGTTFAGGVKNALRVWAIFTNTTDDEQIRKRGIWYPDERQVQLESFLDLSMHDYLVRVKKWSPDHRPLEIGGIWGLESITDESVRTGNQYGQTTEDVVGQRAKVTLIHHEVPIYKYPLPKSVPIPSIEDVPKPWETPVRYFCGFGLPPETIPGAHPGDKYVDRNTDLVYVLGADNA